PGGSSASIWPCPARWAWSSERRIPASTIAVRSPGSYSSTRFSFAVERRTSPPSRSIDTRRPAARSSDASSSVAGSETLGKARPLQRVRSVGAGDLAAQARGREDLAGVREPGRVEGDPQELHRLEVAFGEELRHRARLVHPDPVLAGQRPA